MMDSHLYEVENYMLRFKENQGIYIAWLDIKRNAAYSNRSHIDGCLYVIDIMASSALEFVLRLGNVDKKNHPHF